MPSASILYHWRDRVAAFAEMMRTAREIQAKTLCGLGLEMAMETTVETADLTHLRLNHTRWRRACWRRSAITSAPWRRRGRRRSP
ncbi:MAG: hypothetical protein KGO51_17395 [Alphaproteobacteria bacterium]|nr:hypothetical protein [Alphaproteobacteria bacterium]